LPLVRADAGYSRRYIHSFGAVSCPNTQAYVRIDPHPKRREEFPVYNGHINLIVQRTISTKGTFGFVYCLPYVLPITTAFMNIKYHGQDIAYHIMNTL
jgi:hypothetical protein